MTNKRNTILFIIIGAIVNAAILIALGLAFIILDAIIFKNNNDNGAAIFLIVGILITLFGGSVIYQKLATWVIEKFNLEDKLDPAFAARTMKKNRFDDGF